MKAILRFPEVKKRTGLSRSTVWRLESVGLFPQRIRVGLRGVGWYEAEVEEYNSNRQRVQLGQEGEK
jgi:prophage regulatory protein